MPYLFYSYQGLLDKKEINSNTKNYEVISNGFVSLFELLKLRQNFVGTEAKDNPNIEQISLISETKDKIDKEIIKITELLEETVSELIVELTAKKISKNTDIRKKLTELKGGNK